MVLAPHPDDETLACGGLVAVLRERQIPVDIVFMTDGARSHSVLGPDLVAQRRREAIDASSVLGVDENDLWFLGYPDGGLVHCEDAAANRLTELVAELDPGQIVVPHWAEPNRDHAATYRIADSAVCRRSAHVEALTVPIWLWDQFPWVSPFSRPRGGHSRRDRLDLALRSRLGLGYGRWLTHRLVLGAMASTKRDALAMHTSQTTRPEGSANWPVLADVAGGEWLDLLLRGDELYGTTVLGESATPRR